MLSDKESNPKRFLIPFVGVLLFILLLFVLFLINKDKIFTNLKETDFFDKVFGATPKIIEKHEIGNKENKELSLNNDFVVQMEIGNNYSEENVASDSSEWLYSGYEVPLKGDDNQLLGFADYSFPSDSINNGDILNGVIAANGEVVSGELNNNIAGETANNDVVNDVAGGTDGSITDSSVASSSTAATQETTLDLCFVMIDGDGFVLRKMVKRSVPKSDSPLTDAINLLLAGPDKTRRVEEDCKSLIPEDSRLISAKVSKGIAYLNFNEEFEFNHFGVEGSIHQLEQVVYTATAFSTVNSVQFLIEGQRREYLGSEGQWIGTPLSRANF